MPRKTYFFVLFILSCFFCLSGLTGCMGGGNEQSAVATPSSAVNGDSIKKIKDLLKSEGSTEKFTGTVLIEQDGKVLLREGYGMADQAQKIANTPETRFRIATLSEQFNALSLLLLQDQGKLTLNDPICTYIPDCPATWKAITIQQLFVHTSSIPDYLSLGDYLAMKAKPTTPEQLIGLFKDRPLLEFTQYRTAYNAANQVLAGYIIEKASGQSYGEYLQSTIFNPLHLTHTSYVKNDEPLPAYATGYEQPGIVSDPIDASALYAAGGISSTVDDLYTFDQAIIQHKIGSKAVGDSLLTIHYTYCSLSQSCGPSYVSLGVGYGWFIGREKGENGLTRQIYYDNGSYEGFSAANIYYPEQKLSIIILSNVKRNPITIGNEENFIENDLFASA
ncbi:serine hydrolase domain-containing protein [Tengunoibacter tsumagoiensis]|uniref:Serine hydrolase n=1 Tax=Tengunoibacter tsumagoiensis TaxID=2014871 RepID=A0A402A6G6_9CHLR|nr:serine hydrolase domain-containing protein [Tengunoibacter tsumagoiensis]GCE14718.1 serine hydrolase [Tengunoibacter tsumagoiensis]